MDILNDNYYPIKVRFKIGTIYNDFTATDSVGNVIGYCKQKIFKLKEHVQIFEDTNQANIKYEIRANKWLDFNTTYNFSDKAGNNLGRLARKGWRSLWKASYFLYDENDQQDLMLNEKNAWVKVLDALLSEIPILGMFSGYLFNPSYIITRPDGTLVAIIKKEPSFFGRTFTINKEAEFEQGEENRILLGTMMLLLLERRRG
jgi:uncharacterized protein YxjI